MATLPTVATLAATVATLQAQIADLQTKIATLQAWADSLALSDEASGWKKWREDKAGKE